MNFKKNLKRTLAAGLAAVTMAGMVLPVMAEGISGRSDTGVNSLTGLTPSIVITNRYGTGTSNDSRAIFGAEFSVTKTGAYDEQTGAITAVTGQTPIELKIAKYSDDTTSPEVKKTLDGFGRYEIHQTKRAPGMLANKNLLDKKQTTSSTLQAQVEFPLMAKDGRFDSNQAFELHPKYDPALANVAINKFGNDKTTGLDGVDFSLAYKSAKDSTAFVNYVRTTDKNVDEALKALNERTATTSEGKAVFSSLPVGIYELNETKTADGYQQATKPMYFLVYAKEALENNPANVKAVALTSKNYDEEVVAFKKSVDYDTKDDATLTAIKEKLATSNLDNSDAGLKLINYNTPTVKKDIVDSSNPTTVVGENETFTTTTGKVFQYRFTSKTPGDFVKYTVFKYTDTLNDNITYKDNLTVKAGETNLVEGTDYTVTKPSGKNKTLVVELTTTGIGKVGNDKEIAVTFDAIVNDSATSGADITNKVNLVYVNPFEPNGNKDSGDVKVKIYKGDVKITKIDGSDTSKTLSGATFQLFTKADMNSPYKNPITGKDVTATTDGNGIATFGELTTGTYYLKEINAPEGYKLSSAFYKMEISEDKNGGGVTVTISNNTTSGNIQGDAASGYSFTNYSTTSLMPDTGTRGLIPYAVMATALLAVGTVVVKKKNSKENA